MLVTHNKMFFFFFRILTHTLRERGRRFFKETLVMYIQNGLTLGYAVQFSNLFDSHSFSNVGLTHYFFFCTIKVGYSLTVFFFFELKYTLECGFLKFGIIFILTFYISNLHFSLSCLIIFSY